MLATHRGSGSTPSVTPNDQCDSMGTTFYAWASGMGSWEVRVPRRGEARCLKQLVPCQAPNGTGFPVTNGSDSFQVSSWWSVCCGL